MRALSLLLSKIDRTKRAQIIALSINIYVWTESFEAGCDFDTLCKVTCFLLWITEVINRVFLLTLRAVLPSRLVVKKARQLRTHSAHMCLLTRFHGCCCLEWSIPGQSTVASHSPLLADKRQTDIPTCRLHRPLCLLLPHHSSPWLIGEGFFFFFWATFLQFL